MNRGQIVEHDENFIRIFQHSHVIAVVGLSPKPARDSHTVGLYLQDRGFRIIPVRPAQKVILGEKVYPSLKEIDQPVDIVTVFRKPEHMLPVAQDAIALRPRCFWMQLGIENSEAARLLTTAGIDVVMNRCIRLEHERLVNGLAIQAKAL